MRTTGMFILTWSDCHHYPHHHSSFSSLCLSIVINNFEKLPSHPPHQSGAVYMASFLWGPLPTLYRLSISFFPCDMLALRLYPLLDDTLSEMDKTKVQSDNALLDHSARSGRSLGKKATETPLFGHQTMFSHNPGSNINNAAHRCSVIGYIRFAA